MSSTASGVDNGALGRTILVNLGSGGHTTEMLYLLDFIQLTAIKRRVYVISSGDVFSARKATDFEQRQPAPAAGSRFNIESVCRARHVHQSWLTTPWTAIQCIRNSSAVLQEYEPDLILLNGPGTAVCIILTMYLLLIFGLLPFRPRTVYVESFARVHSLSLSGRILRPFVDRFIVQWEDLAKVYPGVEYRQILI